MKLNMSMMLYAFKRVNEPNCKNICADMPGTDQSHETFLLLFVLAPSQDLKRDLESVVNI